MTDTRRLLWAAWDFGVAGWIVAQLFRPYDLLGAVGAASAGVLIAAGLFVIFNRPSKP